MTVIEVNISANNRFYAHKNKVVSSPITLNFQLISTSVLLIKILLNVINFVI